MASISSRGMPVSMWGSTPSAGGCGLARVSFGRRVGAGLLERRLQPVLEVVERGLGLLDRDVAPLDQRLGVELADRAPGVDALVHQRLGVARVVALVVTVAAVAHHVDHDVLVELLAVGERQPGHPHAGLGVVAVHVEDRRLHHLGHVGRVLRRAGRVGRRGEAELVVDDQVDRAADAVALDHRQVERLGHDALAGEGGVAVDQDRQHRVAPGRIDEVHLGPGQAGDDRVDGLEVRRVGGQLDLDGVAAPADELAGLAEVVLHVARALGGLGVDVALELLEQLLVGLADDVHEHVEPAAVGHAHDGRVEVAVGGRRRAASRGSGWPTRRRRCRSASARGTWWRGTSRAPRPR